MIATNNVALHYLNDRRLKMLGVTSPKENRFVPGIAPIAASVPGYEFESWFGILAPVRTPHDIVERLNKEVSRLLARRDIEERLAKQGIEPRLMSPQDFAAYLRTDFELMSKIVAASGARVEP
jgi:tripartite-type tricarboxylate transporter receptor subunit TctC